MVSTMEAFPGDVGEAFEDIAGNFVLGAQWLGILHFSARSRRRLFREQGLFVCASLVWPPSGPACYTEEEIQGLDQGAVDSAVAEVSHRVEALRTGGGQAYDSLIHARRKTAH